MTWALLTGDARTCLGELPPASVQCVVTSPPYWGLRDYGVPGQLGLESTPGAYLAALVAVFAEVWRVLRNDGTCWVNLGDVYAHGLPGGACVFANGRRDGRVSYEADKARGREKLVTMGPGLKAKNLLGMPWRVAFALQAEGWYLRSDIIWSKPNPMPESVTDRPTKAHEYLFLLTKQERYYYDAAAIREANAYDDHRGDVRIKYAGRGADLSRRDTDADWFGQSSEGRNKRSVWEIATEPYPEAHFATFPTALVEPCVLAGTKPGDVVCDPFCGSGTVGAVAIGLGRSFVGIELNPAYVELARTRIEAVAPLFVSESRHPISRGESRESDRQAKLFEFAPETVSVG